MLLQASDNGLHSLFFILHNTNTFILHAKGIPPSTYQSCPIWIHLKKTFYPFNNAILIFLFWNGITASNAWTWCTADATISLLDETIENDPSVRNAREKQTPTPWIPLRLCTRTFITLMESNMCITIRPKIMEYACWDATGTKRPRLYHLLARAFSQA